MFDPKKNLHVSFRQGDRGLVGKVTYYAPVFLDINSHKFVVVDRNYRGELPQPGEEWVCRFIRDTNPTERRGVLVVQPIQRLDFTVEYRLEFRDRGIFKIPVVLWRFKQGGLFGYDKEIELWQVVTGSTGGIDIPADLVQQVLACRDAALRQLKEATADVDVLQPPFHVAKDGWVVRLVYDRGLTVERRVVDVGIYYRDRVWDGPDRVRGPDDLWVIERLESLFGEKPIAFIEDSEYGEWVRGFFRFRDAQCSVPFTQKGWNGEDTVYGVPIGRSGGYAFELGPMAGFE